MWVLFIIIGINKVVYGGAFESYSDCKTVMNGLKLEKGVAVLHKECVCDDHAGEFCRNV